MKVRGEVFSGVLRGTPLIEKYYPRLIGLLGFKPFKGTMDIKLERDVDITPFAAKTIEHILRDGRKKVDAYMAPVKIKKISIVYKIMQLNERESQVINNLHKMEKAAEEKFSIKRTRDDIDQPEYNCWAVQFKNGIYHNDTVELISQNSIKEKLGLGDGDKIEMEFADPVVKKKSRRIKIGTNIGKKQIRDHKLMQIQ